MIEIGEILTAKRIAIFILGYIVGFGIGIIMTERPEKRRKYILKALGFVLAQVTFNALPILTWSLIAHLERKQAFMKWKQSKEH